MTGKYKGQTSRIDLRVFIPHSAKDQSPLWVTLMQCSIKSECQKTNETCFAFYNGQMEI